MPESTIEQRVQELREKRADWEKEPCGNTWREWSVACTDHMPAILDALERRGNALKLIEQTSYETATVRCCRETLNDQ